MYKADGKSFLQASERWHEGIARAFAALEEVTELTEEHWKPINYLRGYCVQNGIYPVIRLMVQETGLSLKQLWTLFQKSLLVSPANGQVSPNQQAVYRIEQKSDDWRRNSWRWLPG